MEENEQSCETEQENATQSPFSELRCGRYSARREGAAFL